MNLLTICSETMTRPPLEPPESRNSILMDLDERRLPEVRDDSEPLDVLKWELTALKLERDVEPAALSPWKQVQYVRDAVAAEIEVRKRKTPGPDYNEKARECDDGRKRETIDIQATAGTADNPILTTKSLDIASREEQGKKSLSMTPLQKIAAATVSTEATTTITKPPLPPRSKASMSPTKSVDSRGAPLVNTSSRQNYFQPIIIDTVEPGDYDEPIIVHSGNLARKPLFAEPPEVNEMDSAFKTAMTHEIIPVGSLVATSMLKSFGGKAPSPCQNSRIVKSAYVMSSEDQVKWPAELEVANAAARSLDGTPAIVVDHVDLSQMGDADELEAEYKRLVGEGVVKALNTLSAIQSEGSLSQEVGTDEQNSIADDSLEYPVTDDGSVDSDASKDTSTMGKRKALEELRKKSMVVEVSSAEQDAKADGVLKAVKSPIAPLNISTDEYEYQRSVRVLQDEVRQDLVVLRDPSMRRDPSDGHDAPTRRGAVVVDYVPSASSEDESEGHNEEDEINDDRSAMASEREESSFLSKEPAKRQHERVDYDYVSIRSVVAGFFGPTNSQITNDGGGTPGKADTRKRLFTTTSGGCCLGF